MEKKYKVCALFGFDNMKLNIRKLSWETIGEGLSWEEAKKLRKETKGSLIVPQFNKVYK